VGVTSGSGGVSSKNLQVDIPLVFRCELLKNIGDSIFVSIMY
jgi:hypothetical protein